MRQPNVKNGKIIRIGGEQRGAPRPGLRPSVRSPAVLEYRGAANHDRWAG